MRDVLPNKALEFSEDTLSTRSRKKAFAAKIQRGF